MSDAPGLGSFGASRPVERPALPLSLDAWVTLAGVDPLPLLNDEDRLLLGVNVFEPGETFTNHFHRVLTETFIGLSGEIEVWLDSSSRHVLAAGEVLSVPPGVEHFLRNVRQSRAVIAYLKSPNAPDDRIELPWTPST